jgi:predicted O-methyltransferase YrrM
MAEQERAQESVRQADDVVQKFEEVASLLATLDVEAAWKEATPDERCVHVELIEEVVLFPDHLESRGRRSPAERHARGDRRAEPWCPTPDAIRSSSRSRRWRWSSLGALLEGGDREGRRRGAEPEPRLEPGPARSAAASVRPMDDEQGLWDAVDGWIEERFVPEDSSLEGALSASAAAGLPPIAVSAAQGRLLELIVRMSGARSVLEVGTLGGYSTIWMARGLPDGGRLVTLEIDPKHAEVARVNVAEAGLSGRVEIRVGAAADTLATLTDPFDFVFIDADKPSTATYFTEAVRLSHPGTVIVVDNVVRRGDVVRHGDDDANAAGIRRFAELVAHDPRLRGTAIQTVGRKGHDGFAVVVVGD